MVYFLGAGPGDPGLMTYRGSELLERASLVVSDTRVHDDILEAYVRASVPRIDSAELGQAASTRGRKLAELAREHGVVVRLVPHDGVLFSTTTDEAAACRRHDVDFEIVPGVGQSSSMSAYTGTPVTTNRVRSVRFIEAGPQTHVDVSKHRNTGHVISGSVEEIVTALESLLADGWDGDTPVLMANEVSTVHQVTIEATMATAVGKLLAEASPGDHVMMLMGQGIEKRADLSWFESKPLFGWRVLIPRTREQGASTADLLTEYGAEGTIVPTIAIQPPRTPNQMEKAIKALVTGDYQWVGFTSVNAVRAVRMWLSDLGLDARSLAGVKVAAVGGPTAEVLQDWGVNPDLVPSGEWSARGLLADWPDFDDSLDPINRVLLPRADIATEVLVSGLLERGWEVDDVTAYRTVRAAPPPAPIRESIKRGDFDAVLFTSSSTVRNLVGIAGKPHPTTVVACIGPATAQTAESLGLTVDVVADEAHMGSLVSGLVEFARARRDEDLAEGRTPLRPSQRRRTARKKK
nr:uroporphyrinogen-III synthase [Brevibacterium daeguense]